MNMLVIETSNSIGALLIGADPEDIGHRLAICAPGRRRKSPWIMRTDVLRPDRCQAHCSKCQKVRLYIVTSIQIVLLAAKIGTNHSFPSHLVAIDASARHQ